MDVDTKLKEIKKLFANFKDLAKHAKAISYMPQEENIQKCTRSDGSKNPEILTTSTSAGDGTRAEKPNAPKAISFMPQEENNLKCTYTDGSKNPEIFTTSTSAGGGSRAEKPNAPKAISFMLQEENNLKCTYTDGSKNPDILTTSTSAGGGSRAEKPNAPRAISFMPQEENNLKCTYTDGANNLQMFTTSTSAGGLRLDKSKVNHPTSTYVKGGKTTEIVATSTSAGGSRFEKPKATSFIPQKEYDQTCIYTVSAKNAEIFTTSTSEGGSRFENPEATREMVQEGEKNIKTSTVMGVVVIENPTFLECRFNQTVTNANKEKWGTTLTNYFYYLDDDTDEYQNSVNGNERSVELAEQRQFETNIEPIDCVTLTVGAASQSSIVNKNDRFEKTRKWANVVVDELHGSLEVNVDVVDTQQSLLYETVQHCKVVEAQGKSLDANDAPYQMNIRPGQGCDNQKMFVPNSDEGPKKLCCTYCLKRYPKLARHLATAHKDEDDVKKFQALPPGSKERSVIIRRILNYGRTKWNMDADLNGGELSTSRRPNKRFQRNAFDYKTCPKCYGEYYKTGLRRHWNECTGNPFPGERIVVELARVLEGRLHVEATEDLHDILATTHENEEILVVRFDWIVTVYGNDLCGNLSPSFQHQNIRTHIRNAGKLLIAARTICSDLTDFASLYHVKHCNAVIGAIRAIAGFDSTSKTFTSPGTASTLVTLINNIGQTVLIEYMKLEDENKETTATRFLKVFEKDAKLKILKMATATKKKVRRKKTENIPSSDDVGKLATYLDNERDACFIKLTEQYSYDNWLLLANLTLMSVLVFNRKRVGDVQNILVSEFEKREIVANHRDSSLIPESAKELIKSRMMIRGKLNRDVPVLLKHNFDACISLLLRYRKDAGVPDKNEFLFGLPSKTGKIRAINACALFREYSESCGADDPTSLRGTLLRKQFASMCATIELTDNDVTNVANFMGHSDKVHRDDYRRNPFHHQVGEMPELLERALGKRKATTADQVESEPKRKKKESVTDNGVIGEVRSCKVTGVMKRKPRKKLEQVSNVHEVNQRKRKITSTTANRVEDRSTRIRKKKEKDVGNDVIERVSFCKPKRTTYAKK